jgi:hypothetical protein
LLGHIREVKPRLDQFHRFSYRTRIGSLAVAVRFDEEWEHPVRRLKLNLKRKIRVPNEPEAIIVSRVPHLQLSDAKLRMLRLECGDNRVDVPRCHGEPSCVSAGLYPRCIPKKLGR